jgi:hypothetical protein
MSLTPDEQKELDNWFTYHPPTPEKQAVYQHVREQSKLLAAFVLENVPRSADRTAALRSLRGTVMAINLAVACNE